MTKILVTGTSRLQVPAPFARRGKERKDVRVLTWNLLYDDRWLGLHRRYAQFPPFPPSSPEKPPQAGVLSHDGWLTQTRNNNNSAPRGPAPRGGPHGGDDGALRGQGRAAARRARRQGRQAERHRGGRHCRRGRLRQGGGGHAGARGGDAHGDWMLVCGGREARRIGELCFTELIDPALVGTTSILRAVHRSAPSVRRVVVTSSFAAVLTETLLDDPATTFSEASWNPSTLADVHSSPATAYRVSKTLAERAAWDFVAREKPAFDLATVCPPMVYGPLAPGVGVASLDAVNTSNERFVAMLRGKWASEIPATGPVSIWVDVRDVARAHVLAMEKPDAGGRRLYTVGGRFSNRRLVEIVRERFPEYKDRLPGPDVPGGEAPPADKNFKYNNDETVRVLGIKWTSLEDSVEGVVQSLKKYGL
ncbi:NAD dependent epimerase/dehydratase [Purpureocillium lilacinum]|uniref:NAD dependent epimerase/dehydratase n=1 Tax=Purpureocillium lilacinum TaxID=33203 RepID=A0A179HGC3_PURLI|nr:NAD dependent epimerase/dehydratase [Purpureocillium lilacinum]OAQ88668.1 NAD dependent epimerase/dehydratase [Purpureocillium lilacinum]